MVAHALCDHPFQGQFLALHKNRHYHAQNPTLPTHSLWIYCLSAHSLIHAGGVWLITGSYLLAIIELILHWLIDFLKEDRIINFHVDQLLHMICKVAYTLALAYWL
ncbi:MAG: DUF3307 domain-containing protein [Verrucomicrobiaceae bacterium]|nr:DUF3307 domain-containing protein [Verrucomicrobiaceae bacterium]